MTSLSMYQINIDFYRPIVETKHEIDLSIHRFVGCFQMSFLPFSSISVNFCINCELTERCIASDNIDFNAGCIYEWEAIIWINWIIDLIFSNEVNHFIIHWPNSLLRYFRSGNMQCSNNFEEFPRHLNCVAGENGNLNNKLFNYSHLFGTFCDNKLTLFQ